MWQIAFRFFASYLKNCVDNFAFHLQVICLPTAYVEFLFVLQQKVPEVINQSHIDIKYRATTSMHK